MDSLWVNPRLIRFLMGEDDCDDTEELISEVEVEGWVRYDLGDDQKLDERTIV